MQPTSGASLRWLGGWLLCLALAGGFTWHALHISGDLRLFLPQPRTEEQHLLLEGVGDGPATSLLLLALEGPEPLRLAEVSRELAAALRARPEFRRVDNGETGLGELPQRLMDYRYLFSPTLDTETFDTEVLRRELQARVRDLASPAAPLLEPLMLRDPTLEIVKLAESWTPRQEPHRLDGVWFDEAGGRALLVAQTHAAGFDPDGQQRALDALEAAATEAGATGDVRLVVSGPGSFSALMKQRTQAEAQWLGAAASAGMLLLLAVAYRRWRVLVLGALPLLSAGIAGLASVGWWFGEVHGITLAFGFTLIGVAQDYPMHLFSHQHRGVDPAANARSLWPTMATGVASTCVAYLAFLASGVVGLAQLAAFTISGLAVAGLTTRYVMPRIIGSDYPDHGESWAMARTWDRLAGLPVSRWLPVATIAACGLAMAAPGPLWDDDLGALTPVPKALLERDADLRAALGAPDVRYLLGLRSASAEEALQRLEALEPALIAATDDGLLDGYDHAARYLPSVATQLRRQQALPGDERLRAELREAGKGLPFRPDTFEQFIEDVAAARALAPATPADLAGTPLEAAVGSLLHERPGGWVATVTLAGVADPAALGDLLARMGSTAVMVDLKRASTTLVVEQRERILWTLAIAALLLVAVVRLALRDWRRAGRVLAPMALTTAIVVALLHVAGQPLNLFHLIALVLAAGLGLDYALFFERAADDPQAQRRTLHGILVCSASTLMVFALLALSSIPVLRAIGLTVALGVLSNFLLALLMTRPPRERGR